MREITKIALTTGTVFLVGVGGIAYNVSRIAQEMVGGAEEYAQTSQVISGLDGKPGTSFDDWAIAYRDALGITYDPFIHNPRDLPPHGICK